MPHTILVVEDDHLNMKLMRSILALGHYQILEASEAETGLELAARHHPDLILMDVVMPGQNGFQTTRQLSRDPVTQHIPIIIVTTKDQETDRVWAKRQGASDYLVKPVKEEELLALIDSLLKARVS